MLRYCVGTILSTLLFNNDNVLYIFLAVQINYKMEDIDSVCSDNSDHEINEAQHSSLLDAVSQLDVKQRYVLCRLIYSL
jgi:hypothetical protein